MMGRNHTAVLTAVCLIAGVSVAGVGIRVARDRALNAAVAKANSDLRQLSVAFHSWDVDVKTPMPAFADNTLPWILTTPIAYLSGFPEDPFGPPGSSYRVVTQVDGHYNRTVVLASAGPDGDYDVLQLPTRARLVLRTGEPSELYLGLMARLPLSDPPKDRAPRCVRTADGSYWFVPPGHYWGSQASMDRSVKGVEASVVVLPDPVVLDGGALPGEAAIAYLITNGAPPYDVTNGARSNGDIIRVHE